MTSMEWRSFKKEKAQKERNIYVWTAKLSGEFDLFTYIFEREKSSTNIIDNLQAIESKISYLAEGNIKKVKFIRAYIKTLTQENSRKLSILLLVLGY